MANILSGLPSIGYLLLIIIFCYGIYELIRFLKTKANYNLQKEKINVIFNELKMFKEAEKLGIDLESKLKEMGISIIDVGKKD